MHQKLTRIDNTLTQSVIGWLVVITAQKALPMWCEARPGDLTPQNILSKAKGVLNGTTEPLEAHKLAEESWDYFNNLAADRPENELYWFVGFAVIQAVNEILGNVPYIEVVLTESDTDADIDSWSCDTASWAVSAIAGGIWDSKSDPDSRGQFWYWWLHDAIPRAWFTVYANK